MRVEGRSRCTLTHSHSCRRRSLASRGNAGCMGVSLQHKDSLILSPSFFTFHSLYSCRRMQTGILLSSCLYNSSSPLLLPDSRSEHRKESRRASFSREKRGILDADSHTHGYRAQSRAKDSRHVRRDSTASVNLRSDSTCESGVRV